MSQPSPLEKARQDKNRWKRRAKAAEAQLDQILDLFPHRGVIKFSVGPAGADDAEFTEHVITRTPLETVRDLMQVISEYDPIRIENHKALGRIRDQIAYERGHGDAITRCNLAADRFQAALDGTDQ